ncbi:MAG TPA: NUDIX domain-containing protein [Patescibacteria group bacterium]|nr:NUDIX domain-containing protein [Patescibacteria group bacterium]
MAKHLPAKVTAVDIDGNTYEVATDQLGWRPSAYGIVIKDGAVLLHKQRNGYDLPGGGVDRGEMPEHAVVREVKEETGIDVTNPRLLAIFSSFFKPPIPEGGVEFVQSILMYYVCDYAGGELSTVGFDEWEKQNAEMAEWWPIDKLDGLKIGNSNDWRRYVRQLTT